jgi:hypothetical protein
MDLYHLRQGLHVIASSWDYHGGAESRVSVRGNSGRFSRRVDKVIRQRFESITTSSGGLGHWPRTDWFRVLDFRRADDYLQARLQQCITIHLFGHPGVVVPAGSVAAPMATSVSRTTLPTGMASGMVLPSTSAPVNTRHTISVPGGSDYYSKKAASAQSTYLLLHWLQAV